MKKYVHMAAMMLLCMILVLLPASQAQDAATTAPEEATRKGIATIDDLTGRKLAVPSSTVQDIYLQKHYPHLNLLRYNLEADMMQALQNEQCDAAIMDDIICYALARKFDNITILKNSPVPVNHMGIVFNKDQAELHAQFNAFLKGLRDSGELQTICDNWVHRFESTPMPKLNIPKEGTPIRVGMEPCTEPTVFVRDGEVVGLDAELVMRFAAHIGRPIEIVSMDYDGLIPAAVSGKVDMAASGLLITEERAESVLFSDPYYDSGSCIVVLTKNADLPAAEPRQGIACIDDLVGRKLAVPSSTVQDIYLQKHYPQLTLLRYNLEADMMQALQNEQCDAAIMDDIICYALARKFDNITILKNNPVPVNHMGVVFNKDQSELHAQFNAFLKKLRDSGELKTICDNWVHRFESTPMPKLNIPKEGTPIRVGMEPCTEPTVFVRNGEIVGMDAELIMRFAAHIGRPVEIVSMDYDGLIPAAVSGKVDMAASGLLITEERAESVLFSDPYYDSGSCIVILTKNASGEGQILAGGSEGEPKEELGFFAGIKKSFMRNIIAEKRYLLILNGLKLTLHISIWAALLGTALGALVCYLRMHKNKGLQWLAKTYIDLMRGTPILVLLLLMNYVVFANWKAGGTAVAILTFAFNFAAYVSEMFRTSISSIDRGQTEAGIAMGFTPLRTFIYIILPQAVQRVLPVYKGELISLIKTTSIVGYIAIQDLTKAADIIRGRTFDPFFPLIMVAVLYFLLAWVFGKGLDIIGNQFNARKTEDAS